MEHTTGFARGSGCAHWTWLLVGLIGTALARGACERAPTPVLESVTGLATEPLDLRSSSVRRLRSLPGIGNRRAVQVVRARWEHDPALGVLRLGDLPGIGPITVDRVGRALAGSNLPPPLPKIAAELVLAPARATE